MSPPAATLSKPDGRGRQGRLGGDDDARSLDLFFSLSDIPAVGKERGAFWGEGHHPGTAGEATEITHVCGMGDQESIEPLLPESLLQPLQTAFVVHPGEFNNICQPSRTNETRSPARRKG